MSRVLILIAALIVFRTSLVRRRRCFTEPSPYMNSLDGLVSPCQLSAVLEETHNFKVPSPPGRVAG